MVRQVQVTVPNQYAARVVETLDGEEHVHGLTDITGREQSVISFKSTEKRLSLTLKLLDRLGVGTRFGSIDIFALMSTKPRIMSSRSTAKGKKKRKYATYDRMTVEEIYDSVDQQSHLTFDYLVMTVVAAIIAGVGLVQDNGVVVVAAMLVSPLMGPILCLTLGAKLRDTEMLTRGIRNELWGAGICFVVGCVIGLAIAPFYGPEGVQGDWAQGDLTSYEITSRGNIWGLVSGFFVAVPSGIGVATAITGGGINALVGCAISAALLPPVVNSGLCMVFGTVHVAYGNTETGKKFAGMGGVSMLLFLLNLIVIFGCALLMFKIKRISAPKPDGIEAPLIDDNIDTVVEPYASGTSAESSVQEPRSPIASASLPSE